LDSSQDAKDRSASPLVEAARRNTGSGMMMLSISQPASGLCVLGSRGFAAVGDVLGDGLSPGKRGVDGEEAFEREDGHLEEVEGKPGDDEGEDEGEDGSDEVVVVAGIGVGDGGAEVVVEGFEQDVVDVEAVADAAEQPSGAQEKRVRGRPVRRTRGMVAAAAMLRAGRPSQNWTG
jgi:hypothetical protein